MKKKYKKNKMSRCYRLSDLIDVVEELLAIVKALPLGSELRDPRDKYTDVVKREAVLERLENMLDQLWIDQKGFD